VKRLTKILVTEDKKTDREFLVTLLQAGGYHVLQAESGSQSLNIMRREHPDLVITDLLMPSMDGFEFVRLVRADPSLAQTKIVVYTAIHIESAERKLAKACGIRDILIKPTESDVILKVVSDLLNSSSVLKPSDNENPPHRNYLDHLNTKAGNQSKVFVLRATALLELGQRAVEAQDSRVLIEEFCRGAQEVIGTQYASVGILQADESGFKYFFTSGVELSTQQSMRHPKVSGELAKMMANRTVFVDEDLKDDDLKAVFGFCKLTNMIGVPLFASAKVCGVFFLNNKIDGAKFSEEDGALLGTLAAQLGMAYKNISLYTELRESEEHYRKLFETASDMVFIVSPEGIIKDLNPAVERALETPNSIRVGYHFAGVIHPDDLAATSKAVAIVLGGDTLAGPIRARILCKSGKYRLVESNMSGRMENGKVIELIGIGRDVTEQEYMESQLRQSQKMEAVGQLAGGIAHDFNNILSVILGYGERVLRKMRREEPLYESVEKMMQAAQRAATLTQQLLAFSRRDIPVTKMVDLNALITGVGEMLRRLIGEDIDLRTSLSSTIGSIKADPGQMEQVILNLAINARDAMPRGGQLSIKLTNVDVDATYSYCNAEARLGRYVVLAVTDTGSGMTEETKKRLFEPFFTTKEPGKGTGLGLSTVYAIVKQAGGFISVYSELDKGTTFLIHFPETLLQSSSVAKKADVARHSPGCETVLIAEDNQGLRQLLKEILMEFGYKVIDTDCGVAALAGAEKYSGTIDLLITDVVMPGMSGQELSKKIAVTRPKIKVIFSSGYTDDAVVRHGVQNAVVPFLQKPFTADALVSLVRSVLDGKFPLEPFQEAA